jgi:hypothetical protein
VDFKDRKKPFEPVAKLFVSVILNGVIDLNRLKIRDY